MSSRVNRGHDSRKQCRNSSPVPAFKTVNHHTCLHSVHAFIQRIERKLQVNAFCRHKIGSQSTTGHTQYALQPLIKARCFLLFCGTSVPYILILSFHRPQTKPAASCQLNICNCKATHPRCTSSLPAACPSEQCNRPGGLVQLYLPSPTAPFYIKAVQNQRIHFPSRLFWLQILHYSALPPWRIHNQRGATHVMLVFRC